MSRVWEATVVATLLLVAGVTLVGSGEVQVVGTAQEGPVEIVEVCP